MKWLTQGFAGKACVVAVVMVAAQSGPAQTRRAHTAGAASDAGAQTAIKNVFWQPNQLQQGSPAFFTVELERTATRVSATWAGKTLSFFHGDDSKVWYALAGDDVETQPGSLDLNVTAVLAGGHIAKSVKKVDVAAANFKTGAIDVPEDFVNPNPEEKRQIAADEVVKTRAYARSAPKPLWSGNFVKPVEGQATDTFGETRMLNEEKTSQHRGTDFPVKEGTRVVASNAGTVVLAKEMYYEGNCVIVDHGDKFFTIYMHLSKMEVKVGEKVEKGKLLGLSGATGRVTGPHMHMGVRWNGAYLDPVGLLALTLPKTGAGATAARAVHKRR